MPFITTETVKAKRNEIKKMYPNFKFSIRRENHSTIDIAILEAPINLLEGQERNYFSVNHYWVESNYKDQPELKEIFTNIINVAQSGQRELTYDGDYGSVPTFYINLTVGRWDKPFVLK